MTSRKRKILNLEQRVDISKQHGEEVSYRSLDPSSKHYKWLWNVMEMWQNGVNCKSKVVKVAKDSTVNYEVYNLMYDIFCQVKSNNNLLNVKLS